MSVLTESTGSRAGMTPGCDDHRMARLPGCLAAAAVGIVALLASCSDTAAPPTDPSVTGSTAAASFVDDSMAGRPSAPGSAAGPSVAGSAAAGSSVAGPSGADPADGDARRLVAAVSADRLIGDVRRLATGPRDVVENHDAAMAAAAYIETELTAAGLQPTSIDVTGMGVTLPTVWAAIPGKTCPNRVFVLTAHYDTVAGSPGADDDASGVAGVLETARVLAGAGLPITVVIAAVPFEEPGPPFIGAEALAAELIDRRQQTVVGMVSAEMLGYALSEPRADGDRGDYLNVLGYRGAEAMVNSFATASAAWGGGKVEASTVDDTVSYIGRSDHAAFHARGIPAAFATDGADFRTPHYHRSSDTPENIVSGFFVGSVKTLVAGTIAVASRNLGGVAAEACR
jgi:hypothetical protein